MKLAIANQKYICEVKIMLNAALFAAAVLVPVLYIRRVLRRMIFFSCGCCE
jgi:hypothetical protein